jgi:hypothetical protein
MMRARAGVAGLFIAALIGPSTAHADLPTGNLVRNPGAEEGPGTTNTRSISTDVPRWSRGDSTRSTAVRYGALGFPTTAMGTALTGGDNFFAGGPSDLGDDNSPAYAVASLGQDIPIPNDVLGATTGGAAQATLSACLGGYAGQDDYASLDVGGFTEPPPGELPDRVLGLNLSVLGPKALDRYSQTQLLPRTQTAPLPVGTYSLSIRLSMYRISGRFTYNDAYADNISLRISALGSTPPAPDCGQSTDDEPGPQPGGGGPSGGGGTPGSSPDPGGSNTAVGLSRVGTRILVKGRYAVLNLHCVARDSDCKGRVTLTARNLPRLSTAKVRTTKLGSARFRIAPGKTNSVQVKLSRAIRRRLNHVPRKRLGRLKVVAIATIGKQTTRFALGVRQANVRP